MGHLSYVLLVSSMLMRQMVYLRILVIVSAICAMTYAAVWLGDPVSLFWEGLLVVVNAVQLAIIWVQNRRARFTPEEAAFVQGKLPGLSKQEARRLLNLGTWQEAGKGHTFTQQGKPAQHLVYLVIGRAAISVANRQVAHCTPGHFIGEMSVADNGPASATAVAAEPVRFWAIPAATVRSLREDGSRLASALELSIVHDLKSKVVAANAQLGERRGD